MSSPGGNPPNDPQRSPPNDGLGEQVHQTQLKGHTGPVLCLDHSSSHDRGSNNNSNEFGPSFLLSGSEDGTARLWDLRMSHKAALCIVSPSSSEIASVTFAPPPLSKQTSNTPDNVSSSHPFSQNCMVYLSSGSDVYGYDLRHASMPIIRNYDYSLSNVLENDDDVNQLVLTDFRVNNNKNSFHLAAADDNGDVRITDNLFPTQQQQQQHSSSKSNKRNNYQCLRHAQDGVALVTCIGFQPTTNKKKSRHHHYLASGGTDCQIALWDLSRPWKPYDTFTIEQYDDGGGGGVNQVCNPPMVHSLSWSSSGKLLASGLGDGSFLILNVEGKKNCRLVESCRIPDAHDAAIACISFPNFDTSSSSSTTANDRLMISAGNDGIILLWDLGADICGTNAIPPNTMFYEAKSQQPSSQQINQGMASMQLDDSPQILFGIPHHKKPNWIVNSTKSSTALPSTLFVADVSNDITAYTLPHQ